MKKMKEEISVNDFKSRIPDATIQWIYGEDILQAGEVGSEALEIAREQESEDLWGGERFSEVGDYRGAWGVVRLALEGFVFDVEFYTLCNLCTGWVGRADFDARIDVVTWERADVKIVDENGCEISEQNDDALELLGLEEFVDDTKEFARVHGIKILDDLNKIRIASELKSKQRSQRKED